MHALELCLLHALHTESMHSFTALLLYLGPGNLQKTLWTADMPTSNILTDLVMDICC